MRIQSGRIGERVTLHLDLLGHRSAFGPHHTFPVVSPASVCVCVCVCVCVHACEREQE